MSMQKKWKGKRQCVICGHRFGFWHERSPRYCQPCGEVAMEIHRVAGAEFVTEKAVLAARARGMLPEFVLAASVASRPGPSGQPKE